MEPPEWGDKMCWLGNSFNTVFLEKEVEMRGAYVPGKKTFSFRSISMMAKQFEVMEGMGERSL